MLNTGRPLVSDAAKCPLTIGSGSLVVQSRPSEMRARTTSTVCRQYGHVTANRLTLRRYTGSILCGRPFLATVESIEPLWPDGERAAAEKKLGAAIVGSDATVKAGLQELWLGRRSMR